MKTLLLERDAEIPGLATLTLNRPEKLNAINFQMHDEIQQACAELQRDTATRVVILTGAGAPRRWRYRRPRRPPHPGRSLARPARGALSRRHRQPHRRRPRRPRPG